METTLRTFSVLVDDEPGVLSQISRLFSRKGFNIESLAVGPTEERGLSRLTLEVLTDDQQTELLCNQLSKMVPVHSVRLLAEEHSIRREMVLCKVRAEERSVRSELIQLANVFRASILDVSSTSMTLAVIGEESKNEALTDSACWRPSVSSNWCAPAWWRWSGAGTPFRTSGRKHWNSILEKCCKLCIYHSFQHKTIIKRRNLPWLRCIMKRTAT